MSSRQQDSTSSKQAAKLPHFPARKVSSGKVCQSPTTRQRFESLPGVQQNGRTPERTDQTHRGRNGAQILIQLRKHHDTTGESSGSVHGFESPQAARARQQVARDEILSYMQKRRYQQQHADMHTVEPRDTSFDDATMDGSDEPSLSAIAKNSYDRDSVGRSSISLCPKTAAPCAATPNRHPAVHRLMDDDVQASSADQSPTRHVHSCQSLPAQARGITAMQTSLTDTATHRVEKGDCFVASAHGISVAATSNGRKKVGSGGGGRSVKADASRRDEAARVIQTSWRRWQNWKAKLRRDAEERILQQLLTDESGLNLRLLLSGGGSAHGHVTTGGQQQPDTRPYMHAASTTSGGGSADGSGAANNHNATRRLFERRELPTGEPSISAALGAAGGAAGAGVPDVGRFATQRPASAVDAALANRGKSPARPRTVGPSPSREVQGLIRPTAHTTGGAVYSPQALRSGRSSQRQSGDEDPFQLRVHPNKKHVGGHAVYTFVATPTKQPSLTVASGASTPTAHESNARQGFAGNSAQRPASGVNATKLSQEGLPARFANVQGPRASAEADDRDRPSSNGSNGNGTRLHGQPLLQPKLPHHQQPSLDADANPAMASPALSGANSFGDPGGFGAPSPTWPAFPQKNEADSMPSQQQHQPLGNGTVDVRPCTSPTTSLDGQKESLQEPQHACSPSPQRKTRNEALQRLKLQGSQRGSALGHAEVARPLFSPPPEMAATETTAAGPHGAAPAKAAPSTAAAPVLQRRMGTMIEGNRSGGHTADDVSFAGDNVPGRHQRSGFSQPQKRHNQRPHAHVQGREAPHEEDAFLGAVNPGISTGHVPGYQVQGTGDVYELGERPGRRAGHHRRREDGSGQPEGGSDPVGRQEAAPSQEAQHISGSNRHQQVRRSLEEHDAPERFEQARLAREENLAAAAHERDRQDRRHHGHGVGPVLQPPQQPPQHASTKAGKRADVPDADIPREARQELGGPQRQRSHAHTHPEHDYPQHAGAGLANGGQSGLVSAAADLVGSRLPDIAGRPAKVPTHHTMQRTDLLGAQQQQLLPQSALMPGEGCTRVPLDRGTGHRTGAGHRQTDDGSIAASTYAASTSRHQPQTGKQPQQQQPRLKDRPSAALPRLDQTAGGGDEQRSQVDGPPVPGYNTERAVSDQPLAAASRQPSIALTQASEQSAGELTFRRPESGAAALQNPPPPRHAGDHDGHRGAAAGAPTLPCERVGRKDSKGSGEQADVGAMGGAGRAPASGGGSGHDRALPVCAQSAPAVDVSVTAERMTSILKYLEEVELQAEQEATCAAVAPALLVTEPSAAAAIAAALLPGGAGHIARLGSGHTRPHVGASAVSTGSRRGHNALSSRPGTAHTAVSQAQRSQAFAAEAALAGGRHLHRSRSRPRRRSEASTGKALADASEDYYDNETDSHSADADDDDGSVSVGALSTVSGIANRPAFLAESVYENVRTKIRRLQDDVKQRDARISDLIQEVESLQAAQRTCLLDADARLSDMLAAQRAEYESAVSRHLAFVDRLLADKEVLASRANQLADQLKSAEERQEKAIAKLKDGWAAELKRQKELWGATEKQRREAWMQSKAAEIKEVTVKGLEGEVEKLLSRHRAELSAAQQAAADEARRHLDTYVAQNEVAVRQLKERMSREAEEAVEKERGAAATRLREVSERYEQQLQTQRMRLVADADLKLEQLEQARKEEKKRYEVAVAGAREAGEVRQREAEEDWKREKEALRRAHDKQIEALREQYETGQEGWRAAMAERARKEVSERVAAIREKLLQERNEEVQAVMARLEAEHAKAVEDLKAEFRRKEEAAAARAAAELKDIKRAQAKMAERFRTVGVASQAAEERLAASELANEELRRELESRNNTIRWLEAQVTAAKDEAAARERDVRSLGVEKAAVAAEAAAAVARDKQQVEARLAQAIKENQDLRTRHASEIAAVEARVRTTLSRKDDVIAGLRDQLTSLAEELRSTQEVLRQQQEELGSEVEDGLGSSRKVYSEGRGRRSGRY